MQRRDQEKRVSELLQQNEKLKRGIDQLDKELQSTIDQNHQLLDLSHENHELRNETTNLENDKISLLKRVNLRSE